MRLVGSQLRAYSGLERVPIKSFSLTGMAEGGQVGKDDDDGGEDGDGDHMRRTGCWR